jgi:hypothetical protein
MKCYEELRINKSLSTRNSVTRLFGLEGSVRFVPSIFCIAFYVSVKSAVKYFRKPAFIHSLQVIEPIRLIFNYFDQDAIQGVSEVTVKNLRMKTTHTKISKTVSVNMGPQMNRLRDFAHFMLRSATD